VATKLKIEKRGDEIFKKSSRLKLLSQSIEQLVTDKNIFYVNFP
jgi:hypothetical protein